MAAWSALMLLVDMSYTAVLLPLMFAFGLLHPGSGQYYWLSVAVGFLFLADLVVVLHRWAGVPFQLAFQLAFHCTSQAVSVVLHRWAGLVYVFSSVLFREQKFTAGSRHVEN
jgi:hypothetical protein